MSANGFFHQRVSLRVLFFCGLLLSQSACFMPVQGPNPNLGGRTVDDKTYIEVKNLKTLVSGETSRTPNTVSSYAVDSTWFCFDHTRPECAGPESSAAGTNPLAIKGLQLMLKRATGDVISVQGGWFVTAEPRVDSSDGSFSYLERQIRVYQNGAFVPQLAYSKTQCHPTDGKAVGYLPASNSASEKMLSGVEAYGDGLVTGVFTMEGVLNGYSRANVYIHAARVWYSILKTRSLAAEADPFSFYMLPKLSSNDSASLENFAYTSDFGRFPDEADLESSARAYALPRLGLTEDDASSLNQTSWENHVIVGFCLNGTRDEVILDSKRVVHPILFGMKTTTFSLEVKQR